jgi:peptidoglycan/LPS O-acetylase OafA/YrhL
VRTDTAFVDALRGVAALAVAFFHVQLEFVVGYPVQAVVPGTFTDCFVFGQMDLGKYAVGVFFIISGFLIPTALAKSGVKRFVFHRFFRLYPAYWLAIALLLVFERHALVPVAANLTMLQGYLRQPDLVGAFWTLQIELTYYGLCALAFWRGWLGQRSLALAVSISAAIAGALFKDASGTPVPVAMLIAFVLMVFGDSLRHADRGLCWRGGAVALALPIICHYAYAEAARRYTVSYELALFTFVAAYAFRARIKANPVFTFFGEISYSVYLLHGIVGLRVAAVVFDAGYGPVLIHLTNFTVTVLAALIAYRYVEKPAIAFSHRRRA